MPIFLLFLMVFMTNVCFQEAEFISNVIGTGTLESLLKTGRRAEFVFFYKLSVKMKSLFARQ